MRSLMSLSLMITLIVLMPMRVGADEGLAPFVSQALYNFVEQAKAYEGEGEIEGEGEGEGEVGNGTAAAWTYVTISGLIAMAWGIVRLAEWDNAGGPCFIATAAYGTPLAPELQQLRVFRDEVLFSGAVGTAFVDTYYRASPAVADQVAASPLLALVVRLILLPTLAAITMPKTLATFFMAIPALWSCRWLVRRTKTWGNG